MSRRPLFWWSLFAFGAILILAFVPFANPISRFVRDLIGPWWMRRAMAALIVAAALGALAFLRRRRPTFDRWQVLWTVIFAALVAGWILRFPVAAEAFHIFEYGLLGVLAFRACAFHLRGPEVYVAAAVLASIVGAADELVQWLHPWRVWDLRDVGLNVASAILVQLWIALGWRPTLTAARARRPWGRTLLITVGIVVLVVLIAIPAELAPPPAPRRATVFSPLDPPEGTAAKPPPSAPPPASHLFVNGFESGDTSAWSAGAPP